MILTPKLPPKPDTSLVPGLTLPRISGLPDQHSQGVRASLLPDPPAMDSVAGKADLAAVKLAQRLRTPKGNAWAQHMAGRGAIGIWMDFVHQHRSDPNTGRVRGWADTALVAATMASNAVVTQVLKRKFDRPRPFEVDPSITTVVKRPHDASYPSGHASNAFAAARVIAKLAPDLANDAYNMARQVATSRVYGGVHFPSDVLAGAAVGTAVGQAVLNLTQRGETVTAEAIAAAIA